MKRLLPKSLNNPSGFTLIELLIVITIIAVLSVIGMAVYSGIQKNARNARRQADIQAISKAWEQNIAKASPYYPKLLGSWFATGSIPKDPGTAGASYAYTTGGANETEGKDTYEVCATLETTPASTYCLKNQQ